MEGNLHKWTNYWSGWQQRYFVLRDGVLTYYNTPEESKSGGCKRSFKISMFDIIVNKNDPTRVDLIIPNEQYLYLKALDYKERQKWLVALASQKATSTNLNNIMPNAINTARASLSTDDTNTPVSHSKNFDSIQPAGTYDLTYLLKVKQSELRLYCDLLSQQTHDIKNLVQSLNKAAAQSTTTSSNGNAQSSDDSASKLLLAAKNTDNISVCSSSFKSMSSDDTTHHANNGNTTNKTSTIERIEEEFKDCNLIESSTENFQLPRPADIYTQENNKQLLHLLIDPDSIKKMDDLSSNLNITCDMLVTIIKNLIVLSNTSTNVSSDGLKFLLNDLGNLTTTTTTNKNTSITTSTTSSNHNNTNTSKLTNSGFKTVIDESDFHLYHPLYLNSQLSQYSNNKPTTTHESNGQTK